MAFLSSLEPYWYFEMACLGADHFNPDELFQRGERRLCLPLPALGLGDPATVLLFRNRLNETPIGVYRLQRALLSGDVVSESAHHRAAGHLYRLLTVGEPGSIRTRYVAHRGALDVTFYTS